MAIVYKNIVTEPNEKIDEAQSSFASLADFNAAGGIAAYGDGPVYIDNELFISKNGVLLNSVGRGVGADTSQDIAPTFDISLQGLSGSVTRSGSMPALGSRATTTTHGTILEWDNGQSLADGQYIAVTYAAPSAMDLSNLDRLMFEFILDNNWIDARLQIIVSNNSGLTTSSRYNWGSGKRLEQNALMLLKSDFSAFTGGGVNWSSVTHIQFRWTKNSALNANQRARIELRRLTIGQKTFPMILWTHDDNATELYDAWVRNKTLNMPADIFCTDYELALEDNFAAGKCSLAQNVEMAQAGYRFYPHNINHNAYSQIINSYTRSGDTVTIVVAGFGGNIDESADTMPVAGDLIEINDAGAEQLNGVHTVDSITLGSSTTNSTIVITISGASFDNRTTNDGATLTVLKYELASAIKQLREKIKSHNLPTSDNYLAYTYGRNSKKNHKQLQEIGITLARGTNGGNEQLEINTMQGVQQISRRWGMGAASARRMSIQTAALTNAAALQTQIDRLLLTGGLLSVFTHGDDISEANLDACMNLMASYRDSGQLKVVQMHELEAEIAARVAS